MIISRDCLVEKNNNPTCLSFYSFVILNGNSSLFIHEKIFYFFLECPHERYGNKCLGGCHCSNPSYCSHRTCRCANGWSGTGCNDGKSNNIVYSNYIFKYIFTYIYLYIYIYSYIYIYIYIYMYVKKYINVYKYKEVES